MQIQFECTCGAAIEEFTRGTDTELDLRMQCQECGAVYAVTISRLTGE